MEMLSFVLALHTQRFEAACQRMLATLGEYAATLAAAQAEARKSRRWRVRERRAQRRDRERERLVANAARAWRESEVRDGQ